MRTGSVATFNMSAGGNNYFVAASRAGQSGSLSYTGGSGADSLTFGDYLAYEDGSATFDMSAGGTNTLIAAGIVRPVPTARFPIPVDLGLIFLLTFGDELA